MARKFDAAALAAATSDAYSAAAFGHAEWLAATEMLADRGYTAGQAETVLRSKATRWCRDAYSTEDEGKAEYLRRFLDEHPNDARHCGAPRGK